MNKNIYQILLLVWIAILVLYFIWKVWDIHWLIKGCLTLLSTLLLIFIGYTLRRRNIRKYISEYLGELPASTKIILVAGDSLADWIEPNQSWRLFRESLWLKVNSPAELISLYQALDNQNRIPAGLLLIINPEPYRHIAILEQSLSQWRQEIETLQGLYKRRIPISLGIYTDLHSEEYIQWPHQSINHISRNRNDISAYFDQLQQQLDSQSTLSPDHPACLTHQTAASIYLSQQWLQQHVIKNLLPEQPYRRSLYINGCIWLNNSHVDQQAEWRQFEIQQTGLISRNIHQSTSGLKDFPQIEDNMTRQHYLSRRGRYLCYAFNGLLLLWLIGSYYSFGQNRQWLQQLHSAHQNYIQLPADRENEREDAIEELKHLQLWLQNYQAYGAPARMGFGLYHGSDVLPVISNDINSFHKTDKEIIRLDATALFDIGATRLRNDAKQSLQGILTWIQANPNQRVLIDGHTDNTGSSEQNKLLSFNRAKAVRDWLVNASTYPEEHFTVQGYGDSKPIAPNDSEENRSKNRRVEITLVNMNQNRTAAVKP